MSKQTQFIVLDVNHPQHPMHPVDPDNYIVLRQRYGDGKPTKSKPEDFASVDLVATTSVFNAEHTMVSFKDLIICTAADGTSYVFHGEWRTGVCANPKVVCRDLRKDAPPKKGKIPTQFVADVSNKRDANLKPTSFDFVVLVKVGFYAGMDLILCYNSDINGGYTEHTTYYGWWNDGC